MVWINGWIGEIIFKIPSPLWGGGFIKVEFALRVIREIERKVCVTSHKTDIF